MSLQINGLDFHSQPNPTEPLAIGEIEILRQVLADNNFDLNSLKEKVRKKESETTVSSQTFRQILADWHQLDLAAQRRATGLIKAESVAWKHEPCAISNEKTRIQSRLRVALELPAASFDTPFSTRRWD
ncbi:MAG: hypothetical protein F6J93_34380 [Oscillatoria sp. SIO1A7]|nr:hypothetical protein [Oscillatoria sp. SIO1A7]